MVLAAHVFIENETMAKELKNKMTITNREREEKHKNHKITMT